MMKNRLDKVIVERAMVSSRSKAQELIESGFIKVNNILIKKSNYTVSEEDEIIILENDKLKYVSRGGLKLEKAINEFNLNFEGVKVIDIGSSTGGFCDCALKHGASHIIAVDVGTNIMDKILRQNPKIDLHEQTDFRNLDKGYFKEIDYITVDVSFISLLKVLEKVVSENVKVDMICLIKPQFECGKEIASKYKGVILNKKIHIEVLNEIFNKMNKLGFKIRNITPSPIQGGDGNIEYISFITNKSNDINKQNINIEKIVNEAFKNRAKK